MQYGKNDSDGEIGREMHGTGGKTPQLLAFSVCCKLCQMSLLHGITLSVSQTFMIHPPKRQSCVHPDSQSPSITPNLILRAKSVDVLAVLDIGFITLPACVASSAEQLRNKQNPN